MAIPASFVPVMLRGIADRAATEGADRAADAMATSFLRSVSRVELIARTSATGPGKAHGVWGARAAAPRSPAPPGGPPALVTGNLRRSGHAAHAGPGRAAAWWDAVYAAAQHFGASLKPVRRWLSDAGWEVSKRTIDLAARPWIPLGVARMTADGSLCDAAMAGFMSAGLFTGWG